MLAKFINKTAIFPSKVNAAIGTIGIFVFFSFQWLSASTVDDPENLATYIHEWKEEEGERAHSITIQSTLDNLLVVRRKLFQEPEEREFIYYFNHEYQLLRLQEKRANGYEREFSYETIDAINNILGTPSSVISPQLIDKAPLSHEQHENLSLFNMSWPALWDQTHLAAQSLIHHLSQAGTYLQGVRKKLSLTEQLKEPMDHLLHHVFTNGFLQFCGYYHEEASAGCSPFGSEISERVRVTFINGMMNIRSDMEVSIKTLSETHGGVKIHYVFRPTEGWTRDLFACLGSKMGFVSVQARLLAETWRALIEEMGGVEGKGKIVHYSHSIGATDTYIAKELLTPEEQRMINVVTLGSPSLIIDDRGFGTVKHYVSKRDGVSMIIDPIGYLTGLLSEDVNVALIGTHWGIPFIDHELFTETYFSIIKALGKQFVKEYS